MRDTIARITLTLAGLGLIVIGALLAFVPEMMFAPSGVVLGDNPGLLSEIRAPGGFLLVAGAAVFAASFAPALRGFGLALSAMIYLSYGVTRIFSVLIDGAPPAHLMQAMGVELFLGAVALGLCLRIGGRKPTVAWS